MSFGRVIFGDNQFLGINHADAVKAALLGNRFASVDAILQVLGWAYDAGMRDFMFTTHDRFRPVFAEVVRSRLFPGLEFIPCLPYAHKYADAMSDGGFMGVARRHLLSVPKGRALRCVAGMSLGNFGAGMGLLMEIELQMMKGLAVRGVFLQNVFFDLLMGLRATEMIESFHRYTEERLQAIPGYITMNHPYAQKVLCEDVGLVSPWLCANFNVEGFRMNPSMADVEISFGNGLSRNIAMSVFASGSIKPAAATEFINNSVGIDSVLFGSGSETNIRANFVAFGSR